MHRYFIATLLGALAGLILNAAITISCAHYPDLPRPDFFRVGDGSYAHLQDQLMDRELALYVCKHLASDGMDFAVRGALAGAIAVGMFDQLDECWLRRFLLLTLLRFLTCRYAIAMLSAFTIFSFAIYLTNVSCAFLCSSCVLNNDLWWRFLLCGLFPVLITQLISRLRKRCLNVFNLSAHFLCIAFMSSLMCAFWPDLMNPVAYNTASIMGYNSAELYFGARQCGSLNVTCSWIPLLVDSVLLLFMVYVVLGISYAVLVKHVFEPLLTTFVRRPTFLLLSKICCLCFLVLGGDFVLADAWVTVVPLDSIVAINSSSPRLLRVLKLLELEVHSNDVCRDGGDCYNRMQDAMQSNCYWVAIYKHRL